jgi:hypothetical protein
MDGIFGTHKVFETAHVATLADNRDRVRLQTASPRGQAIR